MFVPYRSSEIVERLARHARSASRNGRAAAARGATPVVLVPQFGHDDARDQALRRELLDVAGVPYVFVEIDPAWRIPWDRHPDARAARAIAAAVASRLTSSTTSLKKP